MARMSVVATWAGLVCQSHITSRHFNVSINPPHANDSTLTSSQHAQTSRSRYRVLEAMNFESIPYEQFKSTALVRKSCVNFNFLRFFRKPVIENQAYILLHSKIYLN